MTSTTIRKKLHHFIDNIEEKKAKAIYTLFETEIDNNIEIYSQEFKDELDNRYDYYKNGGKMVTAKEADKQINDILKRHKKK